MNINPLQSYKVIFDKLDLLGEIEHDASEYKGWVPLDKNIIEDLKVLYNNDLTTSSYKYRTGDSNGITSLTNLEKLKVSAGTDIQITLLSNEIKKDYAVCSNWNELLSYPDKIHKPVESIFFTESKELLEIDSNCLKFKNYQNLSHVVSLIKELAEETNGGSSTIIYERPLTFDFTLAESDLEHAVDLEVLNKIRSKDLHKEAITCLLCKELVSFLKDIDVKKRFSFLIQHLSSLIFNVQLSYQGYVENYTFDKVRKEYQEKRTEYVQKVYEVFDNIATKLLSLPAGIWFATTQIEASTFGSMEFAKNITVLITVLSLVTILIFNMGAQFSSLKVLNKEYVGVFDQLASNFEDEADNIIAAKNEILSAETRVQIKLCLSIVVSLILFGLTFWLFCKAYN